MRVNVNFVLDLEGEMVLDPQDPIHFRSEEVERGRFPRRGVVGVSDPEGNFQYHLVVDSWSSDEGEDYFCIDAYGPVQEW
jgi:hypothetical protein